MASGDLINNLWGDHRERNAQNPYGYGGDYSDQMAGAGEGWNTQPPNQQDQSLVYHPPDTRVDPQPGQFSTRLMEGDQGKLADKSHAAKSPKYDFLQLAQQGKYNYDNLGGILAELQGGPNARLWQGWTADKDKLRFSGDPSQLAGEWNGVREVDAIGAYNSGNPTGFRWGAVDPNAPSGGSDTSRALEAAIAANRSAGNVAAPSVRPAETQPIAAASQSEEAAAGITEAGIPGFVILPNGAMVDRNHPLYTQAVSAARPATPADGAMSSVVAKTGDNLPADNKAALMQLLRQRMTQDLTIDPNNPVIRNQSDAYSAKAERARRNYLADTAESRSPYATGSMRNEARMTAEKLGQDTAGFQAELMGRELTNRRQEIQQALDSMGNMLTESERQALQRELAAADNALKRYGIDTQNSQYFAGLSQSDKHFYDQLSQADRLANLDDSFRNKQLGQQDSQFRDEMGFNTADRQAYWDAVRRGIL
jgi:hypothetical protein